MSPSQGLRKGCCQVLFTQVKCLVALKTEDKRNQDEAILLVNIP